METKLYVNCARKTSSYQIWKGKSLSATKWKKHKQVDVKVKTFFKSKKQTERDSSKSSQLESDKPGN